MKHALFVCASAVTLAWGADDSWKKVRELKSGTELRIQKTESRQPIVAQMDEANDDRIIVVLKNEQVSILKEEIDRLEYRPKGGSRMVKESKVTTSHPGRPSPSDQRVGGPTPGPSQSVSSGVSFGSKPDFVTLYRRLPTPPAK